MFNVICCENEYDDFKTDELSIKNFFGYNKIDQYKICKIEDVYNNPNEKYILICSITYYLSAFVLSMNKLPFSDEILKLSKDCKNFSIVIINDSEAETSMLIDIVENQLKEENLNPLQFHICTGNECLPELKERNNNLLNVFVSDKLSMGYSYQLKPFEYEIKEDKKYFFSCFNRRFHKHRFAILCNLKKNNLLEDTNWSFLRGNEYKKRYVYDINFFNDVMDVRLLENEMKYIGDIGIKKADFEEDYILDINENEIDYFLGFKLNALSESYVNITTESKFAINDVVHITEKTIFPFYFYQLPVIVSSYNHVKYVKEKLGLDFFDDVINHSYDDEKNHKKRMEMISEEIKRLHENKNTIIEFYKSNKERLIKNKQLVLDFMNTNRITDYLKKEFT